MAELAGKPHPTSRILEEARTPKAPMPSARSAILLACAAASIASCRRESPPGTAAQTASGAESSAPPLYNNLGTHHHAITASATAQRYFDQGLRLTYAFNHEEAINSFREGARRDPNC